jgi:hypothetical protein
MLKPTCGNFFIFLIFLLQTSNLQSFFVAKKSVPIASDSGRSSFGFQSKRASEILKRVNDSIAGENTTKIRDVFAPSELYYHGSNLLIGYLTDTEWRFNRESLECYFEGFLQNSVFSSRQTNQAKELILFLQRTTSSPDKFQSFSFQINQLFQDQLKNATYLVTNQPPRVNVSLLERIL